MIPARYGYPATVRPGRLVSGKLRCFALQMQALLQPWMRGMAMSDLQVIGQPVVLFAEECESGDPNKDKLDSVLHCHIDLGDLMIVADGVDEHGGGSVASRLVVEQFCTYLATLSRDYPVEKALREATSRANAKLISEARASGSKYLRLGSTVVVALLQQDAAGTSAWIGHIGNSRAYLVRGRRIYRLTVDHSAAQSMLDRSLITPEEALNHPDAAVLTRCLGYQPGVEIDIETHPVGIDDSLLLCSYGLWGSLTDKMIEKATIDISVPVEDAARTLFELAFAAGARENIAVEMARFTPPPEAPRPPKARFTLLQVLTVILLLLAGLCILAWFTL
jgi:serine/threonine protein phosphatase PrpC